MIALRVLLVVCLGLIVVMRPDSHRNKLAVVENTDISSRISAVLTEQGVQSWAQEVAFQDSLRARVVEFRPAGCVAAVKVIPFHITLSSDAFLAMNEVQGWPRTMAHLNDKAPHLSQARLVIGAARALVLEIIGFRAAPWSRNALIIAAPPGCERAFEVDLRAVWGQTA